MTRKRTRESLAHMLAGLRRLPGARRGHAPHAAWPTTSCARILREARQFNPREFRVVASPQVVELLLDEGKPAPGGPVGLYCKPISLQSEAGAGAEQLRHQCRCGGCRAGRLPGRSHRRAVDAKVG